MNFKSFITVCLLLFPISHLQADTQPNIILIMTDDQGIGDFGCTGNPVIQTPHIDAMAKRSLRMQRFYVSPVCAPTRACLLTGRYNYRTRVVDTFFGRAMMDTNEITLAEILQDHGYQTGIFGKWHLGDCFPMRSIDQGFQRSLVHRGGGIGQPSDPLGAEGKYTDPVLIDDGQPKHFKGYCTDIYYDHAFDFIRQSAREERPFFVYLPDNCPHGPFGDAPKDWMEYYNEINVENEQFPISEGESLPRKTQTEKRRQIFSMISNIDENIGKLYHLLDDLDLRENTMIVFLTDNGPNGNRYRCSLRGTKTSVYEGGIRTLFLWDWPKFGSQPRSSAEPVAHIDLLPTLLEACQIKVPEIQLDGRSFYCVMQNKKDALPNRNLFIQTHRGNQPVAYHHFAAIGKRWKLVNHSGFNREQPEGNPKFELFDLKDDPFEMHNVIDDHPKIARNMKKDYLNWFQNVSHTRQDNYKAPSIQIGSEQEPITLLSRQDLRKSPSHDEPLQIRGQWLLKNDREGGYRVTIYPQKNLNFQTIVLHCNGQTYSKTLKEGELKQREITFDKIVLPTGGLKLWVTSPQIESDNLAYQVEIETN